MFKKLLILFTLGAFVLASCSVDLDSSDKKAAEYGSISIVNEDSRALDVTTLTSATVTVSGYGMSDIVNSYVKITDGEGSFTVENIPVGKNRVVTVASNVTGATIRSIVDVSVGNKECAVNWSTTAVGNIFYYLIKKGTDVSKIKATTFDSVIPDVHASLVNAAQIAEDYPNLSSADSYKASIGTVTVTTSNASGYKVQITDIASECKTISGDNDSFTLNAYPGSWKAWVLDSTNTKVAEQDITVVSGAESTVNVAYSESGEAVDFSDKTIVFVKSTSYTPYLYAWIDTPKTELTGGWSANSAMTPVTSDYMADTQDWYMRDITDTYGNNTSAIKFIVLSDANTKKTGDLTGEAGTFWYDGSSCSSTNPSPAIVSGDSKIILTVNSATPPADAIKIYVSADSAPTLWAWTETYKNITTAAAWPGVTMTAATGLKSNDKWYVAAMDTEKVDTNNKEAISFIINSGADIVSTKTTTFWYDAAGLVGAAGAYYDEDPTSYPKVSDPTATIKPADGKEVPLNGAISINLDSGNGTLTEANVTISGAVSKTYSLSDFAGNVLSFTPQSLGITETGKDISIRVTVKNSVPANYEKATGYTGSSAASATLTTKEEAAEDPFTWDNVNCYFVLTDRFYNGDSTNDHSYSRSNNSSNSSVPDVATFHGGDLAGLTQKLDYFDKLGVNAIWITAPYEQIHGWVGGKDGAFPHYAFHGYYTLDWTALDQNMGTLDEFRTFVNACHSKGIRVVMDVVMNHVGYNNLADMITYKHGSTTVTDASWIGTTEGKWVANVGIDWSNDKWDSWWGPFIRSFGYDEGTEYGGSCGGLPDVKTELTSSVGMAPVMVTKWAQDSSDVKSKYYNPSVANADWNGYSGDYRTDKNVAPAVYQEVWLSAWVREFGIDGFRCDTAKHVEPFRWGELKVACQAALEAWREDSSKSKLYNGTDTGAADWDESFWMTGEYFGWTSTSGEGEYYTTGKFDSMINFQFNGSAGAGTSSSYPSESTWSSYININKNADSDGNGNRNNVLTYISSHDTKLCRASNQAEVGTMLQLTPGGIQIYYGDETSRLLAYTDCGDTDMATRGDFNWSEASGSTATHWGKVGKFRKYNPAVGAGTGTAYKRTYSGSAGDNSIAISLSSTTVDVSDLFADGTTVYNWYDGKSSTVSGGSVTFSGSSASKSAPVLVSDKNPADYGVTF